MPVFVDTNVLVYARDASEPERQARAAEWMAHLWRTREGRVSMQVLEEYYVTVTRKLRPGLRSEAAREDVRDLLAWRPLPVDATILEAAWSIEDRYGSPFWDACILASARASGAERLLTEDLQHGSTVDGVLVVDPFRTPPGIGYRSPEGRPPVGGPARPRLRRRLS